MYCCCAVSRRYRSQIATWFGLPDLESLLQSLALAGLVI